MGTGMGVSPPGMGRGCPEHSQGPRREGAPRRAGAAVLRGPGAASWALCGSYDGLTHASCSLSGGLKVKATVWLVSEASSLPSTSGHSPGNEPRRFSFLSRDLKRTPRSCQRVRGTETPPFSSSSVTRSFVFAFSHEHAQLAPKPAASTASEPVGF